MLADYWMAEVAKATIARIMQTSRDSSLSRVSAGLSKYVDKESVDATLIQGLLRPPGWCLIRSLMRMSSRGETVTA